MCIREDLIEGWNADFTRRGAMMTLAAAMAAPAIAQPGEAPPPTTRVLDDPRVQHGPVDLLHNGQRRLGGYLARPRGEGRHSAVLVIAGNRISEEYIPNSCAILALEGFVALAPDIFHVLRPDAAPADFDRYLAHHTELDRLDDVQIGLSHLRAQPFVDQGGVGVMGFCSGGRSAMLFGARSRDVDAVVAFHPGPTAHEMLRRLSVPVQVHQGTRDRHIPVSQIEALERFLRDRRTPVETYYYEGADHGFIAYTRPPYYRPDYAVLSMRRTAEFLRRHIRPDPEARGPATS